MGEPKSSWSFVGISQEARDAAEEAADASGMELDTWLSQLIKYTSAMELKQNEAPERALERTIMAASAKLANDDATEVEHSFPGLDPMPKPERQPDDSFPGVNGARGVTPRQTGSTATQPIIRTGTRTNQPAPVPGQIPGPADGDAANGTHRIRTDHLHPSNFSALSSVNEPDIQQAIAALKKDASQTPVVARPMVGQPGHFEVIAAVHYWHAARRTAQPDMLVSIRSLSDEAALKVGLLAQLRRAPLSALKEATVYLQMMTDAMLTTEQVSRLVGKPPAHIATMVRILNMPKPVRDMLERGDITVLHARALLNAPNPEAVARDVVKRRLDIYQTEQLVRVSSRNQGMVNTVGDNDHAGFVDYAMVENDIAGDFAPSTAPANGRRLDDGYGDRYGDRHEDRYGDPGDFAQEATQAAHASAVPPPLPGLTPPPRPGTTISAPPDQTGLGDLGAIGTGNEATTELLERHLARLLEMKVSITESHDVGAVTLHYTTREQLSELIGRLNGGGKYG